MSKLGYFIGGAIAGIAGVFITAGIAVAMEESSYSHTSINDDSEDDNEIILDVTDSEEVTTTSADVHENSTDKDQNIG